MQPRAIGTAILVINLWAIKLYEIGCRPKQIDRRRVRQQPFESKSVKAEINFSTHILISIRYNEAWQTPEDDVGSPVPGSVVLPGVGLAGRVVR